MAIYTYTLSDFADSFVNTKRLYDQFVAASLAITSVQVLGSQVRIDSSEDQATVDAEVASYANDFSPGQDEIELVESGGNVALDLLLGNAFRLALNGNYTLSNPTNLNWHDTFLIRVIQSAGGGNTLSFGNQYMFESGTPPVISAAANAIDLLTLYAASPNVIVAHMADLQVGP